jgi:hypothetical protein
MGGQISSRRRITAEAVRVLILAPIVGLHVGQAGVTRSFGTAVRAGRQLAQQTRVWRLAVVDPRLPWSPLAGPG